MLAELLFSILLVLDLGERENRLCMAVIKHSDDDDDDDKKNHCANLSDKSCSSRTRSDPEPLWSC